MDETSTSLLERLCSSTDAAAWERLVNLYTPLIQRWLRRSPLQASDVDDLVQEVLAVVVRRLPSFRHDARRGGFRCWLRTITVNCLRHYWRSCGKQPATPADSDFLHTLDQLEDPSSGLSRVWDREHDQHVVRRLLTLIAGDFKPTTWQAFWRQVMEGATAETVAAELKMSVNAVVIAKSRVLQGLRREATGFLDADHLPS